MRRRTLLDTLQVTLTKEERRKVTALPPSWFGFVKCPTMPNGWNGQRCGKPVTHNIAWLGGRHGTSVSSREVCQECARDWAEKWKLEMPA